jgi:hypothetical protein
MVRNSFRRQKNAVIVDLRPESHQLTLFKVELTKILQEGTFDHRLRRLQTLSLYRLPYVRPVGLQNRGRPRADGLWRAAANAQEVFYAPSRYHAVSCFRRGPGGEHCRLDRPVSRHMVLFSKSAAFVKLGTRASWILLLADG